MARPLGDLPRKQPYKHIAGRMNVENGRMVHIIHDEDQDIYYTGFMLTIENIHVGGPYGCRTSYDKDDAYNDMSDMT